MWSTHFQSFETLKHRISTVPIFIGPFYLPLLISVLILVLFIILVILTIKQAYNKDKYDELAQMNRMKAGYYTKYILALLIIFAVIMVKDFNVIFTDDTVGNILRTLIIVLATSELIENIIFIILEKRNVE